MGRRSRQVWVCVEELITKVAMPSPVMVSLYPGSWHHIQNLDSFFTKISFVLHM